MERISPIPETQIAADLVYQSLADVSPEVRQIDQRLAVLLTRFLYTCARNKTGTLYLKEMSTACGGPIAIAKINQAMSLIANAFGHAYTMNAGQLAFAMLNFIFDTSEFVRQAKATECEGINQPNTRALNNIVRKKIGGTARLSWIKGIPTFINPESAADIFIFLHRQIYLPADLSAIVANYIWAPTYPPVLRHPHYTTLIENSPFRRWLWSRPIDQTIYPDDLIARLRAERPDLLASAEEEIDEYILTPSIGPRFNNDFRIFLLNTWGFTIKYQEKFASIDSASFLLTHHCRHY